MGGTGDANRRAGEGSLGVAELRAALESPDAARRVSAIRDARLDPSVEPVLILYLADIDPGVRIACIHALVRVAGSRGVRALIRAAAQDPWPTVRAEAVTALGAIMEARAASGTTGPFPPTTEGEGEG